MYIYLKRLVILLGAFNLIVIIPTLYNCLNCFIVGDSLIRYFEEEPIVLLFLFVVASNFLVTLILGKLVKELSEENTRVLSALVDLERKIEQK